MMSLLFALLLGHMPTENWNHLDESNRTATIGIMAKRYFRANDMCAEAEISMEEKDGVMYFYGTCKKPFA